MRAFSSMLLVLISVTIGNIMTATQLSTDNPPVSNDNPPVTKDNNTTPPTTVSSKMTPGSDNDSRPTPPTNVTSSRENPPSVNDVSCTFSIANESADDFTFYIRTEKFRLAYLLLMFPEESRLSYLDHVFRPFNWIWTYQTTRGAEPFLDWTRDYRVLSLGVLDSFTKVNLAMKMQVHPPDCPVVLGSNSTTQAISNAIGELMMTTVSGIKEDYNHSIWCYQEIRNVSTLPDLVANTFGVMTRTLDHRCCRLRFNATTRTRQVSCTVPHRTPDETTTTLPYILGVIGLLYFPIWLCSFAYTMSPKSVPCSSADQARESTLDVNISHDVIWLYQGTRSPVTLSSTFTRTFPYFKRHPHLASRLQRLMFLLLLPSIIYIRLVLYFIMEYEYLQDCIKRNLPIGYLSMFFGFEMSRQNVFTVLGGPYILHCVYFTVGALLFCIPRDLSRSMCSVLQQSPRCTKNPMRLDLDIISRLGGVSCSKEDNNYKLVNRVLRANLFMLINIDFWTLISKLQFARFVEFTDKCSHLPRAAKYVLMTPIFVLYIILCFTEVSLCILYYGVPLIYFIILIIKVYIKLTIDSVNNNGYLNNKETCVAACLCLLKYPASCLVVVALSYILYTFCAIVVSSFAFLFGIMTFTFIGIVAYPSMAFGYYTFGITSVYYVWKAVREINIGYMKLFKKTIAVSRAVEKEMPIIRHIPPPEPGTEPEVTSVVESEVRVSCVKMCGGRPGIPKDLFETVIERHRPFRVCVLVSVLKLSAVFLLIVTTLRLVNKFSQYHDISVVVSFLSSLIVVSLPRVFSLVLRDTDREAVEEDFSRRLSKTVRDYWSRKDRRDLISCCWTSQQKV